MNLRRRLERLEARAGGRRWLDLDVWKAETAAGVTVDEQERRRLAEYPEHKQAIREHFEAVRRNLARLPGDLADWPEC